MSAPGWWAQPPVRMRGTPPPYPIWREPARPFYQLPAALPWVAPTKRIPLLAAVSFIASRVDTTGGTTLTVNYLGSLVANDTLILYIASSTTVPVTGFPAGWSLFLWDNGGGSTYVKTSTGAESGSFNVTVAAVETRAVMQQYRGCDPNDPILAYECHASVKASTGRAASSSKVPDTLYFLACDYMGVTFVSAPANIACVKPTGWTQAGQSTGGGGGGRSVGGGYLAFTNTEALSGVAAWTTNTPSNVTILALRANGNGVLSLKASYTDAETTTAASLAATVPILSRVGDLVVAFGSWKHTTSGTVVTSTAPTSYTRKGTDQSYVISAISPFSQLGAACFSKILNGVNDTPTMTLNITTSVVALACVTFSTGTYGLSPSLPGTAGQANDTTNDTTIVIPAMGALEDYAANNILLAHVCIERGDTSVSEANGWFKLNGNATASAGLQNNGIFCKMNSGATPAASSVTSSISQRSVGWQIDVAVVYSGHATVIVIDDADES